MRDSGMPHLCPPTERLCQCAGGYVCLAGVAMCLLPTEPCPGSDGGIDGGSDGGRVGARDGSNDGPSESAADGGSEASADGG